MAKKIILSEHQSSVFNDLIESIDTTLGLGQRAMFSLTGPAGCGKTVLTSELISYLLKHYAHKKLKLTTPTHTSLGVAKDMVSKSNSKHKNFSFGTIHSHLKLKMETKEDKVNFLLIDESSMISEEIFNHIKSQVNRGITEIVIFIGDKVQLPPIDSKENSVFNGIQQFKLTEVVRQAMDNPLLKKATEIRYAIEAYQDKGTVLDRSILNFKDYKSDEGITVFSDFQEWLSVYINATTDKTLSAYTNHTVVSYNEFNRKIHLGLKNPPYLVPGDVVVLQSAYSSGMNSATNGSTLVVDDPWMSVHDVLKLNYWEFTCEDYGDLIIKVLDPSSKDRYDTLLQKISAGAKKLKADKDHLGAKNMWEKFWKVKNEFVEIKYNYAHTIHKLQGSTYEEVYINMKDVLDNVYDDIVLFHLIYVALTRASLQVLMLV